jgi:proteic killer suppression protein
VIIEFENDDLADLYEGNDVKGKPKYQKTLIKAFMKTVRILQVAPNPKYLYRFRSLNYEPLKGKKKGLFSVRVNNQYRLEFRQHYDNSITVINIIELSNHYK